MKTAQISLFEFQAVVMPDSALAPKSGPSVQINQKTIDLQAVAPLSVCILILKVFSFFLSLFNFFISS